MRSPWHGNIQRLPPLKNSRHQPALGNWWRLCFGTWMVCFCCTFLLLTKQWILLLIRPLSKNLRELFSARSLRCKARRVLLLHDSARPHTAHATVNLLERWGWEILEHPSYSPDLTASVFHLFPNVKKTSPCQTIQITWWCQAWGANMASWSGSHLLSAGFWEMDFPPRQVPQQRRWLCENISEVSNKWIKRHLTMWSYLVAIK